MARNTGAINRVFSLFGGTPENPTTATTAQINEAAGGDGTRRYRDLIQLGQLKEISRARRNRQVEYTAVQSL